MISVLNFFCEHAGLHVWFNYERILMEQANTSKSTSAPTPAKSFMTAGPTLHYSHTNVLWFWFLTVIVYIITCVFWYSIVVGGPISIDFSEFLDGSAVPLGYYITNPISIYEYPQYIIVLGVLMGILAVGPVLVSQLLSFRYSVPLILSLMFIGKLYLFSAFVLVSCIAVACRPLRFRSRFISVALCMAPQLVYWAIWGGHRTPDAVLWALSYAPWISAWLNSLIMAALILGIGHFTRYKPGLNWLTYLLFLGIAFSVFQQCVGFAELDYQRRVLGNSLEDIMEFQDASLSSALDEVIADPALRSKLEGRFYPTNNPIELRQVLKEDILESLHLVDQWPEWFRRKMPEQFKYKIKRQQLMVEYEEFIEHWSSNRKRMPAALYYRAMLSELRPDLRGICSEEMLRFYYDYPFKNNVFNWQELLDQFPQSPESLEARWRIAMYEVSKGNYERALSYCEVALALIKEFSALQSPADGTNDGFLANAFGDPQPTVITSYKMGNLKNRFLKLQACLNPENQGDDEPSRNRLNEFLTLNRFDLNYSTRLDNLLEQMTPEDGLRDNVMLEKALLAEEDQHRLVLLTKFLKQYPNRDTAVRAQYETARTKIQIWKNLDDSKEQKKQFLDEAIDILSNLIEQHPESLYCAQAEVLLQTLPKVQQSD